MNKICLTCQKEFDGGRKTLHCSQECKTGKKVVSEAVQKPDLPKPTSSQKEQPKEITTVKPEQPKIPITRQMKDPPVGSNAWKLRNEKFD